MACLTDIADGMFQMKGIRELVEALIPYTQRHYSRIDRLVRSTFLLDYTLTGMSVIEPEIQQSEVKVDSSLHAEINRADEEHAIEEQDLTQEKDASKKRKLNKSKHGSHKKVKAASENKVEPMKLQA